MYSRIGKYCLSLLLVGLFVLASFSGASADGRQAYTGPKAKYVFFIIGDGMAQPQRTSTEMYLGGQGRQTPWNSETGHERTSGPRHFHHFCSQFHYPGFRRYGHGHGLRQENQQRHGRP